MISSFVIRQKSGIDYLTTMKVASAILALTLVATIVSCRKKTAPADPSPLCTIPATDSFRADEVQYAGGIRMFTAAGEITNPATLTGFINAHPFFSAVAFSEPYTPVTLYFTPGDKAAFTSFASTIHFNAQCEGHNILMQSTDTTAAFTITDTTGATFLSQLFYPQNLNFYTVTYPSGGPQYQVRVVAKYRLYLDGSNYYAEVNRYYYNLHNTRFAQSSMFQSAVLSPTVSLSAGDTLVFQKGTLLYQRL